MFWFLGANFACTATELADIHFQTIFSVGFMYNVQPVSTPFHYHLNCELLFVKRGQCTVHFDEQDCTCKPSDILLINDGTRHTILQRSPDSLIYSLQFSFSPGNKQNAPFYSRLRSRLSAPILLHGQDTLFATLDLLRREFAMQQPLYETTVEALLQVFYAQLLRSLLDMPAPALPQPFSITPPTARNQLFDIVPQTFYKAILDSFFNSFPLQKATLSELCNTLRLSAVQTRRIIKKYYGVSFQERLIQSKLEKSKFLMATTDLSMKAIAEQSGYGSYHAFYEAFTTRTGQTPSQYRKTYHQKAILAAESTQSH